MFLIEPGADEAPEWAIASEAVARSHAADPAAWSALAACRTVEIYTDGSAPVRNPGGQAGFAAVVVGFKESVDSSTAERPAPHIRIDIGGYIPARGREPKTSNNRAEIAAVMAALAVVRELAREDKVPEQVTVWSDSKYAVMSATGEWKRKKNTDLWHTYDLLAVEVGRMSPVRVVLQWVKGHAGNEYNEAADELASRAAFNFDPDSYARFRAAQVATGKEMPGEAALRGIAADAPASDAPVSIAEAKAHYSPAGTEFEDLFRGADYTLLVQSRIEGATSGPARGVYHLEAKNGRSHHREVAFSGNRLLEEAEYLTLIAALEDLSSRISAAGRHMTDFTLTIYSGRELVVKQLSGVYKVKSPALQEVYRRAAGLLRLFKRVEVIQEQPKVLAAVLKRG